MRIQCNNNQHKCNNHTSATAVEKIDNQAKALYNKINLVLSYKQEKYFPITLEQMLQQLLKKKQQCVLSWKNKICKIEKRAKVKAASKTLPIWQYFTQHKKLYSQTKQNRYHKSYRDLKCTNK